jgi:hypothetical protein
VTETAALELICGRCGQWLLRWTADLGKPFDDRMPDLKVSGPDVLSTQAPGGYRPGSDGRWYRWAPGPAERLPEGEIWDRWLLTCPRGCRTNPQARGDKLNDAAAVALRHLHATRQPLLRVTMDSLLKSSA